MVDLTSIPRTDAMLATSTDIYVVLPIATKLLGVELTVPLTARIGTINKLTRENNRDNTRRYGLGKHSFEPYDVIPGQISTTLTAKGKNSCTPPAFWCATASLPLKYSSPVIEPELFLSNSLIDLSFG